MRKWPGLGRSVLPTTNTAVRDRRATMTRCLKCVVILLVVVAVSAFSAPFLKDVRMAAEGSTRREFVGDVAAATTAAAVLTVEAAAPVAADSDVLVKVQVRERSCLLQAPSA
jgi:hypothetical protein